MIITLDGPAGTGKSSVALAVADRLGFDFLDTGAMYRAIGLEAIRRNADLDDSRGLAYIASHCRIEFDWSSHPPGVVLNGEPVTHLIRGSEPTRAASKVAAVGPVREQLVEQQRRVGRERPNLVTEGRDQGSVVFPDARFKFYLDATAEERARRRAAQLRARGEIVDPLQILREIRERDHRDSTRAVGPLTVPRGATVIDSTGKSQEQVVDEIVAHVKAGQPA